MDSGQRTVDSGQWKAESGQLTVDSGKHKVDSGQWKADSGQWTVDSGQWTEDSGPSPAHWLPSMPAQRAQPAVRVWVATTSKLDWRPAHKRYSLSNSHVCRQNAEILYRIKEADKYIQRKTNELGRGVH